MSAMYEFYLNGTLLADEPIGWEKSKKKITRSDKFDNIFLEYITDLTFHGDGYNYLINRIETLGNCATTELYIKYRCSQFANFEDYFWGIIDLNDIEIDHEQCTIKCNAEDSELSGRFLSRMDKEVSFSSTYTITGGSAISLTQYDIGLLGQANATSVNVRKMYKVYDVLEFFVKYYTDNQMSFASTYFGTSVSSRNTQYLQFATAELTPASNKSLSFTFTNTYEQQATKTCTILSANTAAQNLVVIAKALNSPTQWDNGMAAQTSPFSYLKKDHDQWQSVTSDGVNKLTLVSDMPINFDTITGITYTLTPTEVGWPDNGKKDMLVTNGYLLRDSTTAEVPYTSFEKFFTDLNKRLGLSFSIERIAGVPTLRVEPLSYFVQSSESVYLTNVSKLKQRSSDKYSNGSASVGDDGYIYADGTYFVGETTHDTWTGDANCYKEDLDLRIDNIVAMHTHISYISPLTITDEYDKRLYWFEGGASTTGNDFDSLVYTGNGYQPNGTLITYYNTNNQLNNYWAIHNNALKINGDLRLGTRTIVNTKDVNLQYEYEFEAPLSNDDYSTIQNNKFKYIRFNKGTDLQNDKIGYLLELEYDNLTNIGKFKLLAN